MDFYEILDQVVDLLKQRGRITHRTLRRQFALDDETLEDLKDELLFSHPVVDEDGRGLVWTGGAEEPPVTTSQLNQPEPQPVVEQAQPVQAASSPVAPHTPDAERRQLTVMFCDLVDSTKLSSQLDPEDYREVVREYQTTCGDVIERFGCHIAQTLGDGLLIYSGYPVAHENDAELAVRTGLGILNAMKMLNERLDRDKGLRLAVRVGIHTGPVVVGEVGAGTRQEQLALGATPNIAARLQGIAQPDAVVISAETYRLTQSYFDCDALGEHDLRGISQPITVYQVLQESGVRNRFEIARVRGLTPFVGRHAELQLLLDRWHQAKSGEGQVVLLNAEPGLGKSRLIQSLREKLVDESYTRLECSSYPYSQNLALGPVSDLIEGTILQWEGDDSTDAKLGKLEQALSRYRLPLVETVPLMAGLLSLAVPEDRYPPLKVTPQRQRQRTLETIIAIIVALAKGEPVCFILEDLHWADPSTLELLDLLVDQMPTASIYMLLTCRPEFQSRWANRPYFTQLTLTRLSGADVEQMVVGVTGGKSLPDDVLQQLVEKTDGVPLYVEEMTKSVLESGMLKEADDQYVLSGADSSLVIPSTLQDSLMSRLDRLVTAKAVAQYASVIGRQFSYALLQAVSELDDTMLQRELGRLVEAELVYQRGVIPDATYIFKHALVQDIAYASLLRRTRQHYHRQIANALAEQFAGMVESQPEFLAHHYVQGGIWEKAFVYLLKSGDKARQASANQEAITFYTRVIEVSRHMTPAPNAAQLMPVYEGRGLAWMLRRNLEAAIADFQHMLQLARASGQLHQEGESLCHLAMVYYHTQSDDHLPLIEQYAQEAQHLAYRLGDAHLLARSLNSLGSVATNRGHVEDAERHFAASLQLSRREGYHEAIPQTLRFLSSLAYWQGHFPSAIRHAQEGATLAREFQESFHELHCLAFQSLACWSRGDYPQAFRITHEVVTTAQEQHNVFLLSRMKNHLGWFSRELGAASRAVELDHESTELGRTYLLPNVEISALINLGFDYVALGQPTRAASYFEPILDRVVREAFGSHSWRWKIRICIGLAELSYMTGDYAQAFRYVEEGVQEAQATSSQKYVALGWALRGKIVAKLGDPDKAGTELQRAFALAEQLQSPSLFYPIAYDFGQWHERIGKERDAVTLYGKAKTIIEQMATAVGDEALRSTFLQSALVQEIHERAARLGG